MIPQAILVTNLPPVFFIETGELPVAAIAIAILIFCVREIVADCVTGFWRAVILPSLRNLFRLAPMAPSIHRLERRVLDLSDRLAEDRGLMERVILQRDEYLKRWLRAESRLKQLGASADLPADEPPPSESMN